jgi:hypothetical protein
MRWSLNYRISHLNTGAGFFRRCTDYMAPTGRQENESAGLV